MLFRKGIFGLAAVCCLLFQGQLNGQDTLYLDSFYPDYNDFSSFGFGISSFGNTVVIASPGDDGFVGAAYVYQHEANGTMNFVDRVTGVDPPYTEYFGGWHEGHAIDIHENHLLVGADYKDEGVSFLFEHDGNGKWPQIQKLKPAELLDSDSFGSSVAIHGDVAVVSAPLRMNPFSNGSGAVYIYRKDPATAIWSIDTVLYKTSSDPGSFGDWIALTSPSELIISGIDNQNIFVYRWNSGTDTWSIHQTIDLKSFGVDPISSCCRLDASENYMVVSGIAYLFIFRKDGNTWILDQSIFPTIAEIQGLFGYSVSINEQYLLVGAPVLNNESGMAYLYARNGLGWYVDKVLLPIASDGDHRMGEEVHLSENMLFAGAPEEDKGEGRVYAMLLDPMSTVDPAWGSVESLQIYPNPAHQEIAIRCACTSGLVTIVDALGKSVLRHDGFIGDSLDVGSLESGVYRAVVICSEQAPVRITSFVKL